LLVTVLSPEPPKSEADTNEGIWPSRSTNQAYCSQHHGQGGSVEGLAEQERAGRFRSRFEDETAFRAWYDATLPRVYGYLFDRCGGNKALAEELTQETFEEAIRGRARFDGRADEITWIVGIARHRLADHYRRLERDERRHLKLLTRTVAPAEDVSGSVETRRDVLDTLARLPAMQRAVLALHYLDGMPLAEIGEALGKSEAAVDSLMSRGRKRFKELLHAQEGRA
jgi:RNA polymerase sigma-70 factor (ECF subfamily)